jgi:hypothetical protein
MAIWGICALVGCESAGNQYDGVSRFAGAPYYGPGSPPREPPPAPELPDGSGSTGPSQTI